MKRPVVTSLSRYQFAAETVARLKSELPLPSVYDVGAGEGAMRPLVESEGLAWRGFDVAPKSSAVVRWNLDDTCPEGFGKAGMVLLIEVIEHLRNPGLGLRHLAEILPVGGRLLITTPNPGWSRSRVHLLHTGYLACFTELDTQANAHVFPVWPHVLLQLLSEAGFAIETYTTLDGRTKWPGRPWNALYPLRALYSAMNQCLEWRDPSACGMSYGVVARRIG